MWLEPPMRSSREMKISVQSSAKRDVQSSKGRASRTRVGFSPGVSPFSLVVNCGLDIPSGHYNVSIGACIMERKSILHMNLGDLQ